MVSSISISNPGSLIVSDNKTNKADEKIATAAESALKKDSKNSFIKLKKIEDLSAEVNDTVNASHKEIKVRLQDELTTSTKRKIIVCAVIATIVFLAAMPWIFPMLFADIFAWQIASILFAGSVLPISLVVGWKLTYGETPHKTLVKQMQESLNTASKLKSYAREVREIMSNYEVSDGIDRKKAFLDLIVDPALYDLLRNPKHEGRKKLDEARKQNESLEKKIDDLTGVEGKQKELEEAQNNLEEGKKSLKNHRSALYDEEETILKKYGIVKENAEC